MHVECIQSHTLGYKHECTHPVIHTHTHTHTRMRSLCRLYCWIIRNIWDRLLRTLIGTRCTSKFHQNTESLIYEPWLPAPHPVAAWVRVGVCLCLCVFFVGFCSTCLYCMCVYVWCVCACVCIFNCACMCLYYVMFASFCIIACV